jgi:hypothetical protein
MQVYSDKTRENDTHSLPDVEVFYVSSFPTTGDDGELMDQGYYWQACFPGCLPDGSPNGPFDTAELAKADAQDII